MALILDQFGNPFNELDKVGGDPLVDTRVSTQTLGAAQAETVLDCANTNSVAVEVRGTFIGTILLEYSIDGTNYDAMPIFNPITELFVTGITTVGKFVGHLPSGTKKVRARMSAYTSGAALVSLRGSQGDNFLYSKPLPSTLHVTATAAAGATITASLAAASGLFHYITRILVQRIASVALTAGAAPSLVTTTNLNSRVIGAPADAAPQGAIHTEIIEPSVPIKSAVSNTASTIVAPAITGVIWRISVDYYIGN